ncbi:hypothetical protein B0H12DRAFT_1320913 [Mycena haematopus]|nr:hypothetical protein B0H12DRAFT_1320913 [Mycena haematopus]
MSAIRWLLAVLRKLILDNTLVRSSIRGLLLLFSALWRATKKGSSPRSGLADNGLQSIRVVYPQTTEYDGGKILYPALPADIENRVVYTSASLMPASLHPYLHSGPSASRSSQDITAQPITQASYSLHSLSHLPALPPSPNLGLGGYLPSTNSSVVDFHLPGPATESPSQSRRSSGVYGDIAEASPPCLSEAHPRIFPGTPETVGRYNRKTIIPKDPTTFSLRPLTIFALPNPPPPGWTTCQHPEGAQYFFHEEKRVFTDANLFDSTTLVFINDNVSIVNDFLRAHNVYLEPGVDLVLDEYVFSDGSKGCQYYFVNHLGRCVFWMDNGDSDLFPVTAEVKGMTSASHIRHELEAQYWLHCEYYPRAFEVTHEIVDELRDIVLHAFGTLSPPKQRHSQSSRHHLHYLRVVNMAAENVGKHADKKFTGSSCLVGRLMHVFARNRVYNFHGEPGARLNVDQSVHAIVQKRTMLIKMLSPLLFYAPDFHLLGLHAINTDGLIRHSGWAQFVTRLNSEWQEFTLYATVVLNANVAFLSIQSVDQGGNLVSARSPAQISSYVSILASIASTIIGLLLVKHHRNRDRDSAAAAATFIFNRTHPTLGLETLAVLYALPYAMLIWSMVSFLAAFSFMCFQESSLLTRTLVAVVWAAVAALILWCVFNSWESSDWDWLQAEDEGDATQQEETKSVVTSETKPKKKRWTMSWPIIALRKESYDSDRTVTNV